MVWTTIPRLGNYLAAAILVCMLAGCGSGPKGPALFAVKGAVTFDGTPVETGRIEFRKTDGDGRAYSGEIKNGTYNLQCEAGKMSVSITASRIIPGKFDTSNPDDEPQPVGEMYIPKKYNDKTELTAEVKPAANDIPFTLTK